MSAAGATAAPQQVGETAWGEGRLEPAPGVRHLQLGQRAALFCGRAQQLFELNATADFIWRSLAAGRTPAEAAEALAELGAPPDEARAFVAASAGDWLRAGRLLPAAVAARARTPPAASMGLRIAGFACTLALHAPPGDPTAAEAAAVFGQFADEGAPGGPRLSALEGQGGWFLLLDGTPLGFFPPERIVPEIKAVLTERLASQVGGGAFLLHGALLSRNGRGLLLSGAPGAGKTTLTVTLAARGLGYGSDDIVRVAPGGALSGVPFAPAVKSGAWALAASHAPRLAPRLAARPVHLRGDGQAVRYLPAEGLAPYAAGRLGAALLLDRRAGEAARIEPLEPLAVLAELLRSGFAADRRLAPDALEGLAGQLAAARCGRLIYSDLAEAAAAIEALLDG